MTRKDSQRHVVLACQYGEGRFTECSCGRVFQGFDDAEVAARFNLHSRQQGSSAAGARVAASSWRTTRTLTPRGRR